MQTDIEFKHPIGLNLVVSSATTFQGKSPSFSVAYLDPVTMLPINLETYAFDLAHANEHDEEKWVKMWDYLSEYELEDLSPASMQKFSEKMFRDEKAASLYKAHRNVKHVKPDENCDFPCRQEMYCQTVSNDYDEY